MRFYLRIDPDELSDSDWGRRWNDLLYALTFDRKRHAKALNQAMNGDNG